MKIRRCKAKWQICKFGEQKSQSRHIRTGTAGGFFYHKVLHVKRILKGKVNGHKLANVAGCCVFVRHKRKAWSERGRETQFCEELGIQWRGVLLLISPQCETFWKWRQLTLLFTVDTKRLYWWCGTEESEITQAVQALSCDSSQGVFHLYERKVCFLMGMRCNKDEEKINWCLHCDLLHDLCTRGRLAETDRTRHGKFLALKEQFTQKWKFTHYPHADWEWVKWVKLIGGNYQAIYRYLKGFFFFFSYPQFTTISFDHLIIPFSPSINCW